MKTLILSLLLLFPVASFADDPKIFFDPESMKKRQLEEIAAEKQSDIKMFNTIFKNHYNKEPSVENLTLCLEIENPQKRQISEIKDALSLINMRNIASERIGERAEWIYHNVENSYAKYYAAQYILKNKDKETGIKYLLALLEKESKRDRFGVTAQVVGELLKNENYAGFYAMSKIITSQDLDSEQLFRAFLPYNGKPYNAQGDKIDLQALLETNKAKTKPELYQRLKDILEGKDPWARH